MPFKSISTQQCINQLQIYANTEVRSWNPFKLFRKEKVKNYQAISDMIKRLEKPILSDDDLVKITSTIGHVEDVNLQHHLICFLYTQLNEHSNSFMTKRENIGQINKILQDLLNKKYKPWWTLFLIEMPYFTSDVRNQLKWTIRAISDLFITRRNATKQHLINIYSNEIIINQILSEYCLASNTDTASQKELSVILDLTFNQTVDDTKKMLIKEIQKSITEKIPFGQLLISAAVFTSIINSYLAQKENQNKSMQVQAQEILRIIGTLLLKVNASQMMKSFIPGIDDLIEAVVSVTASKSSLNPLHTDQKIGKAVASVAGGAVGGAIGTTIPFIGTYVGAYVGTVVSKTAATRFYQVLEAWQKAPRGSESIIPCYSRAYFSFIDNDAKNILKPLYNNYLETEKRSKILGDEIAQWLCIYTLLQNSDHKISEEFSEIIHEEMSRLKLEFTQLKNSHGKLSLSLFNLKPDNDARVMAYKSKIKECLHPLHHPIIGMLNEYFSPAANLTATLNNNWHKQVAKDCSIKQVNEVHHHSIRLFNNKQIVPSHHHLPFAAMDESPQNNTLTPG